MNAYDSLKAVSPTTAGDHARGSTIPVLVGKIYDAAPMTERCRLLEHLMKPLGALALVGVSNGIFAKIWFRGGWHNLRIRPEDAETVQGVDVISLVEFVQQSSAETIYGLASLVTTSPLMVYSGAAAMLVAMLARSTQTHRNGSAEADDPPNSTLPSI